MKNLNEEEVEELSHWLLDYCFKRMRALNERSLEDPVVRKFIISVPRSIPDVKLRDKLREKIRWLIIPKLKKLTDEGTAEAHFRRFWLYEDAFFRIQKIGKKIRKEKSAIKYLHREFQKVKKLIDRDEEKIVTEISKGQLSDLAYRVCCYLEKSTISSFKSRLVKARSFIKEFGPRFLDPEIKRKLAELCQEKPHK